MTRIMKPIQFRGEETMSYNKPEAVNPELSNNTYADGYVDGYFDSGKTPPPPIDLDEADELIKKTDYIIEATHQDINPINLGDAAAFFIEGYEYCRRRIKGE